VTICVARLVVRYGKLAEWNDAMARLVPIMEDQGWKLLASYQTIIGNLHEAYDIWEIPNADAVGAGLVGAASHPDLGTLGADLAASIETETLSIVAKTSFSP
jgi:NIPSNAP